MSAEIKQPPQILIVSGLDPTGGAGFLADARVVADLGGRAVGVPTALTEQDTNNVYGLNAVEHAVVRSLLAALLEDCAGSIRAVKIGMLVTNAQAHAVAGALALVPDAPVVWDPVMRSSGGVALMEDDARVLASVLFPRLTLMTPNLLEAQALTGIPVRDRAGMRRAGEALCEMGAKAVLVKGGHLAGDQAVDVLVREGGSALELVAPRIPVEGKTHGTGCVLSSAIATHLGHGANLFEAASSAKDFLGRRLEKLRKIGGGARVLV
ncbi:MAG: hydroxymethylpyrimidine/phosphomethylpyrimidine kinase [Deltaproteobacteria bacterium]|nr:hydroxymethylpyrimidine/phosphomethylpyrimidine kinase [Deltaproteobacteria bacterium]